MAAVWLSSPDDGPWPRRWHRRGPMVPSQAQAHPKYSPFFLFSPSFSCVIYSSWAQTISLPPSSVCKNGLMAILLLSQLALQQQDYTKSDDDRAYNDAASRSARICRIIVVQYRVHSDEDAMHASLKVHEGSQGIDQDKESESWGKEWLSPSSSCFFSENFLSFTPLNGPTLFVFVEDGCLLLCARNFLCENSCFCENKNSIKWLLLLLLSTNSPKICIVLSLLASTTTDR